MSVRESNKEAIDAFRIAIREAESAGVDVEDEFLEDFTERELLRVRSRGLDLIVTAVAFTPCVYLVLQFLAAWQGFTLKLDDRILEAALAGASSILLFGYGKQVYGLLKKSGGK